MTAAAATRALILTGALALATGCRVDELDLAGKQCPCTENWLCDEPTNTCVRDPARIDAAELDAPVHDGGDGPMPIDALDAADGPDAPPGSSCLGTMPGASLYTNDFGDLTGITPVGGTWTAVGGEAVQNDAAAASAYAFPAGQDALTSYRMTVAVRRIGGSGAAGLAARIQAGSVGRYRCTWSSGPGTLRLEWIRTNGMLGGTLATQDVDTAAIPGYDANAAFIVELETVGNNLRCCVRDLAGAAVSGSDNRYVSGAPGIETTLAAAGFDTLRVNLP